MTPGFCHYAFGGGIWAKWVRVFIKTGFHLKDLSHAGFSCYKEEQQKSSLEREKGSGDRGVSVPL